MIEKIKEKIEELKEVDITFEDVKEYITNINSETIIKIISIVLIIPFLYLNYSIYKKYIDYKKNIVEKKILEYNNEGLKNQYEIFKENKKNIDKIKLINWIYKPSLERLYCLIDFVRNKINKKYDIYNKYFISNIKYSEKNNWFNIEITWIKHYNDLIKILYYLKIFKDILEINYSVKLEHVNNGGRNISYYTVDIKWTYVNLQKLIWNLEAKKNVKKRNNK